MHTYICVHVCVYAFMCKYKHTYIWSSVIGPPEISHVDMPRE